MPDIYWLPVEKSTVVLFENRMKDSVIENILGVYETSGFFIAKYPITNMQFRAFLEFDYHNPRWWSELAWQPTGSRTAILGADNHVVKDVAWYEAVAYCRWLTEQLRVRASAIPLSGHADLDQQTPVHKLISGEWQVRLPTEYEWQSAAIEKELSETHSQAIQEWFARGEHNRILQYRKLEKSKDDTASFRVILGKILNQKGTE